MKNENIKNERLTRQQAIRKYCLQCCLNNSDEVLKCVSYNCALWRYRRGRETENKKSLVVRTY